MKTAFFVIVFLFASLTAFAGDQFPKGPDPKLTPGSVCDKPDKTRYPEKIDYCDRDVETERKRAIIKMYDDKLGFQIGGMNRQDFKIDHFVPLCMGGSNETNNLWPQHKSVYKQTDMLEQVGCEKMSKGRLRQADAIRMIREAKLDLRRAPDVLAYFKSL
jgi:hypothetical protein